MLAGVGIGCCGRPPGARVNAVKGGLHSEKLSVGYWRDQERGQLVGKVTSLAGPRCVVLPFCRGMTAHGTPTLSGDPTLHIGVKRLLSETTWGTSGDRQPSLTEFADSSSELPDVVGQIDREFGQPLANQIGNWPTSTSPYKWSDALGHVDELCVLLQKGQPHHAGGTVALLGHDDLGRAAVG